MPLLCCRCSFVVFDIVVVFLLVRHHLSLSLVCVDYYYIQENFRLLSSIFYPKKPREMPQRKCVVRTSVYIYINIIIIIKQTRVRCIRYSSSNHQCADAFIGNVKRRWPGYEKRRKLCQSCLLAISNKHTHSDGGSVRIHSSSFFFFSSFFRLSFLTH